MGGRTLWETVPARAGLVTTQFLNVQMQRGNGSWRVEPSDLRGLNAQSINLFGPIEVVCALGGSYSVGRGWADASGRNLQARVEEGSRWLPKLKQSKTNDDDGSDDDGRWQCEQRCG